MQPAQDLSLYNILRLNSDSATMFTLQKNKLRLTYNVLAFLDTATLLLFFLSETLFLFSKGNFMLY